MQHEVDPLAGVQCHPEIADVAFDDFDIGLKILDILTPTGREIVQDADLLSAVNQFFDEIGADKSGAACNQVFHINISCVYFVLSPQIAFV